MSFHASTRMKRRAAVVSALAATGVLAAAGTASAHVTVDPGTAAQGSYTEVSFRAPNEQDDADTTKIQVFLPTDHPIASVATEPVPGWTATVQKTKLAKPITTDDGQVTEAVTEITWTGGSIASGQFQDFPVSLGPLPGGTSSLTFKTLQTYSNGQIARWIEQAQPGQPEPQNPAPVLHLTPAGSSADEAATTTASTQAAAKASGGAADTTARTLGIVGIVVGAAGALLGFFGWRRGSGSAGSADSADSAGSSGSADSAGS